MASLGSQAQLSPSLVFVPGSLTINGLNLGTTSLGYALRLGSAPPIQITFSGQFASTSNPGDSWTAIAAAAFGSGFELFWRNTTSGQFGRWILDASGSRSSAGLLNSAEILAAESKLNADLTGDGSIGLPYTPGSFTLGSVNLGTTSLGYALRLGSAPPIQITFSGQFASTSNPGDSWTAIAAAAFGSGFELFWRNTTSGQFGRWILDASGSRSSAGLLNSAEILAAESKLNADLTGDGSIGLTFTPGAFTLGSVNLGTTSLGYALRLGSAPPIQITFSGQFASTSNPGDSWTAIAAAAFGSGFELFWRNTTSGQFGRWILDASGSRSSAGLLNSAEILAAESKLNADLTGDGSIGLPFTPGAFTLGSVNLGTTSLGYALRLGSAPPIQITFSGQFASTSNPGDSWTAIAAAAFGSGFELFWRNTTSGQFGRWILDASGSRSSAGLLNSAEILAAESKLNADLTGDGSIGLPSPQAPSPWARSISAQPPSVTPFGLAPLHPSRSPSLASSPPPPTLETPGQPSPLQPSARALSSFGAIPPPVNSAAGSLMPLAPAPLLAFSTRQRSWLLNPNSMLI